MGCSPRASCRRLPDCPRKAVDGQSGWYELLLFRNEDRTRFSKIEFYELVHQDNLRKLAPRVVLEKDFRKSLISDDPEPPKRILTLSTLEIKFVYIGHSQH